MTSYLASAQEHFYHDEAIIRWPSDSLAVVYSVLSLLSCYYLLASFDILPAVRSSHVIALFKKVIRMQVSEKDSAGFSPFERFRTKGAAIQRMLGVGENSFLSSFPGASGYSITPPSFFASNKNNPPGLGNWDNSCYQNSIIQSLASLHSLNSFLNHNIETLGDSDTLATHMALKCIVDRLNRASNSGQQLWTPPELKSMSSWQQQDAQEYLSKVIEELDKETRDASKGLTNDVGLKIVDRQRGSEDTVPASLKGAAVKDVLHKLQSNNYSPRLLNPLEGLLAQRVGCMLCGWTEGLSLFQFNCLTVSLGGKGGYDIQECLDEYTALEPIEGVDCAKCTLLRTQAQLEQLLKQFELDSDTENQSGSRSLSDAVKDSAEERLRNVRQALTDEDFSEKTLSDVCRIPTKGRVSATKSRQAVIARAPKSLAIHVNRSVFDELTGILRKNYADVNFPKVLDLGEWCLGTRTSEEDDETPENWALDPSTSMLHPPGAAIAVASNRRYELRAVITHYGRHENGHYICYRKYPLESFPVNVPDALVEDGGGAEKSHRWFKLSDEDVSLVSESNVIAQGGVFMLFYELVDDASSSSHSAEPLAARDNDVDMDVYPNVVPLRDISSTPRKDKSTESSEVGQNTPYDEQSSESSPTSAVFDKSSSSTVLTEDTAPQDSNHGVQHGDLLMRSSPYDSGACDTERLNSVKSPVASPMVSAK